MVEIKNGDITQVESLLNVEFDLKRQQAIKNFDDVQACPGSGKTTMVAAKLIILARKWKDPYRGVCVLTHTNVAKNEIIARLTQSSYGEKLLSFPHFIGTIQEFVNKFLAIPYLRSGGYQINTIDDDICSTKGWHYLSYGTKSYLERKRINSLYGMEYKLEQEELKLTVPGFTNKSTSRSYKDLVSAKSRLIKNGYYFYGEMYVFAKHYLLCNPNIKNAVRSRFPIVLIDEMQDTQRFQDELLNDIFLDSSVKLQRFGDPDQAIYSGEGEENQTYNQVNLDKIENSHRFDHSIALLAKNLSFNHINLSSGITVPELTSHTIFLVNEHSRSDVLDKFAELCEKVIPLDSTKPIKTVGAVGLRKDNGLTICDYVDSYDKSYSTNTFKPLKLIHYFYESKKCETIHEAYRLILEGIARCGQISGSRLTFSDDTKEWYTTSNIRKYLKNSGHHINFNNLIKRLMEDEIEKKIWDQSVNTIKTCLGLTETAQLKNFLDFDNCTATIEFAVNPNKIITEVNGRIIENEVATIHSVKGETHAATLVLETKNHEFDIGKLIEYILGDKSTKPIGVRKPKFMKQLYVAFSRPKNLLCVALDKSRFPIEHVNKKEYAGWKIIDLTTPTV
ncbi:UvrD-helicase domain-containing protein [uncultured Shewanella sp.]|uniref:UvrD-helicase domain-containing protein n=1 Tax=uncultured Shewanella sp. TaxID=173975 RepID=UPI002630D494|nr:UvrD-helicase domain-containing protein [uncultured Shewanella sp.]